MLSLAQPITFGTKLGQHSENSFSTDSAAFTNNSRHAAPSWPQSLSPYLAQVK
jgi:hypothetical protein